MPIKGKKTGLRPIAKKGVPRYYRAGSVGFRTATDYVAETAARDVAGPAEKAEIKHLPQFNGRLEATSYVASVGPLRSLHGKQVREVIVPSQFTPGGVPNPYVLLSRNDERLPKYVRVRLSRNGTEGRIAVGTTAQASLGGMEWIDLTFNSDRKIEFILENGDSIYVIGTWPGVVPIQIQVTVTEWNP